LRNLVIVMRKLLLTALMTLAWLLASPRVQWPDNGWLEVGATSTLAQEFKGIMVEEEPRRAEKPSKKKQSTKKQAQPHKRVGSSGVVTSNQPGKYPVQQITPPQQPNLSRTVIQPERDPRYPNVPTVPVIPGSSASGSGVESSQDRVIRCTHQGGLGGIGPGQQGTYVHNCAF
jgi:hypothetical protein